MVQEHGETNATNASVCLTCAAGLHDDLSFVQFLQKVSGLLCALALRSNAQPAHLRPLPQPFVT